jgi:hypothetical protein
MLKEANSDVVQTDQIVQSQWNEIVFTENIGWAMALKDQNQLLNYTV